MGEHRRIDIHTEPIADLERQRLAHIAIMLAQHLADRTQREDNASDEPADNGDP
ncbi:hypothetical protein [Actinokineospora sp. NBRC 105648]|uniref:hypothetical protein n=1 Tax=Actinokineospora sp. NBRC 105648 TaxID=3032206 RepID=UPI0024A117A2|nr:hypothetical protein [Actinokineospora sp. NBRC 105648]GLZ41406.1 hypothetical protein Acsp05_50300 [Actinokineospora sp. NBRC 105648]